ncbi:nuclear pore complex protein DDB_G0274915-like [Harmonia axyridis]|uniref:nuclear pore complex protein DDB_G0274915-like n=1 Tax=Harmonia axyridis TaxID=115357 RepID=UPI001E27808B|nr:nuclear pore complex protein DDB_G0274915-like [Harmonia axyridis]
MMNSSSKESPQQKRNANESKNITTILPPEITSTPFISNKTKVASPLITPTRKFLGPRRYALSNNGMLNPIRVIKDPPGPLLASTTYNVNVSTYIDTKSPGLAGRLVQYNEESSQKQQNTHQERYGSPGLFPIVHLFKKSVPVISPKLKKGTIRIGTPESRGYYSQEHNRSLLEGIVRNNSILKEQNNSNEVSTRSVLDALKEISRKRIHSNEDYDPIDDNNKKFRKANGDGDYSKRNRVESPPSDKTSSPTTQAKKRLCTIDAVLASKTSSMYTSYDMGNKRKTFEDSHNRILPVNKKKYTNVETQTSGTPVIVRELKRTSVIKENDNKKSEEPVETTEVVDEITSPKPVLKVLDDKPLEVIRKNRLGALLSALSGREIPSIPMEDRRKALDQDWPKQDSEKALVSILSPPNKQTKAVDKHVTFDLSKNTKLAQSDSSTNTSSISSQTDKNEKEVDTKTEQSKSFPLRSTENNTIEKEKQSMTSIQTLNENVLNRTPSSNKLDNSVEDKKGEKEKIVGGFKFDLNKSSNSKSSIPSIPQVQKSAEESKTDSENTTKTNFASPTSASLGFKPMFGTSPFKLEDGKTKPTAENSFTKSFSSPTTNSLGLPSSLPINTSSSSNFSFATKSVNEGISVSSNVSGKTNAVFAFGKTPTSQSGSETSTLTASPSTSMAAPSGKTDGPSFNSSPFGSKIESITPSFAFGGNANNVSSNPTTTSSSLTSSAIPSISTTSVSITSTPSLGTSGPSNVFTSNTFNTTAVSSSPPKTNFGVSGSSSGGFKFNNGNSLPPFGSSSANSATTQAGTTSSNVFGSSLNATFSPKSEVEKTGVPSANNAGSTMFGNNLLSNKSLTTNSTFGSANDKNMNSSLASSSTPNFTFKTNQGGVATTNTSASTASNVSFSSTVPSFGTNANNIFSPGKTSVVPPFGATTTSSSLGSSNTFTFGKSNTTSLTTPSSTTPLFSNTNTAPSSTTTTSFGTTNTPFGTTNSPFGTTNTPSFASSNTPNFGTTNTLNFGTTNTSNFGTTNTPSFATTTTPSFGTTSNTPSFASTTSTPSFGTTTNTPSFASTTSTPSFGTTTNTPSFGSSSAPSFGTTNVSSFGNTNAPNFGTTTSSAFGTSNKTSFSTSNTSAFGSTNTPNFGTSNASPFGSSNTSNFAASKTPAFGNNNTSAFGGTSTPAFGTTNTPSFGTTNPPAFGTTNTPAFGTTNASAFGTTNNTPSGANNTFGGANSAAPGNNPTFGTPTSNMFGTTNTPSFGNATTTSNFGTSFSTTNTISLPAFGNPTSPFGNVAASNGTTFNSNNNSSPFGNASGTNSFGTFNTNNTQFTPVTNASSFGTNSNNNFGNSSATNAFGSSATNNTFAASNPASPFGTNTNNTAASNSFATSFGKKPEQSSSIFPAQSNNMFNSNSTFGSVQPNNSGGSGGSSTSGVFTFGSSNSNPSSSAGVFTFGTTEPPKSFNFNAASTPGNMSAPSASNFNSPGPSFQQQPTAVPNMFSIGSGNAASTSQVRGRPLVRARRRT